MARRRYQKGNLRKRGKRNPVWELQWWTDCINADGTIGRKRESTILGYVSELTRRQARKRAEEHLRPLNLGKVTPLSNLPFRVFIERHFVPNVFPTLKLSTQGRYRCTLNIHLLPAFGDSRLCDIGTIDLQHFVLQKMEGGLSWAIMRSLAQLDVQDIHDREEMELLPGAESCRRSGVARKECRSRKACSDSIADLATVGTSQGTVSNHGSVGVADRSTGRGDSWPTLEGYRFDLRPVAGRADHLSRNDKLSQNPRQPTHVALTSTYSPNLAHATRATFGEIRLGPCVLDEQRHSAQRYQFAAPRAEASGPKDRHPMARLAHSAANSCHIATSGGRLAQGCSSTVGTHETIYHARNLHRADTRTSAGGGRKPGAFGDEW